MVTGVVQDPWTKWRLEHQFYLFTHFLLLDILLVSFLSLSPFSISSSFFCLSLSSSHFSSFPYCTFLSGHFYLYTLFNSIYSLSLQRWNWKSLSLFSHFIWKVLKASGTVLTIQSRGKISEEQMKGNLIGKFLDSLWLQLKIKGHFKRCWVCLESWALTLKEISSV